MPPPTSTARSSTPAASATRYWLSRTRCDTSSTSAGGIPRSSRRSSRRLSAATSSSHRASSSARRSRSAPPRSGGISAAIDGSGSPGTRSRENNPGGVPRPNRPGRDGPAAGGAGGWAARAPRRPPRAVRVRSGGIANYARDGMIASLDARLALRDEGIQLGENDFVSTDLRRHRDLLAGADLILTMTVLQKQMLAAFDEVRDRPVFTLR